MNTPKTLGIDLSAIRKAAVAMSEAYRSAGGELSKVDPDVVVEYLATLDPVRIIALCDAFVGIIKGDVQYTTTELPSSSIVH